MLCSSPRWNTSLGYPPPCPLSETLICRCLPNGLARYLDLNISASRAKPSLHSILPTSMNNLLGCFLRSIWVRAATTENLDGRFNFFKLKIF